LIVRDWTRGDEQSQAFLQDVHAGACTEFTTVLGPGANIFHYNHIHVDLALHGNTSSGPRRICRPQLRPSPIPGPPRDGLPNPPEMDEDVDIAQPSARIPDTYFAAAARVPPAPVPPEPVRGSIREDGAFVPEGQPSDWDLPSTIPPR
jgi:hypothetical protein